MRFGSKKIPLRVVIAGFSLAGLGVAAALPTVANDVDRNGVDPMITESVDKVDTDDPTQTDMPPEAVDAPEVVPRQIIPQQSSALSAPAQISTDIAVMDEDVVVSPVMSDDNSLQPAQGLTASLAGEALDPNGIILALDHARVMRVVGEVATIIIGNPAIADAAMPDPGTIVLTGKSYGETNMVMLDHTGAIIAEQTLRVTVRGQSLVSVYRGVQRTTLSCAPTCEIRPTPGDNPDAASVGLDQFQARNQAALEAVRTE